jgi:fumarylpyruvate hydrolase
MSLEYVIPPPKVNSIPIAGDTRRFAVNRIFCVGRNYADHAREMGHDPDLSLIHI